MKTIPVRWADAPHWNLSPTFCAECTRPMGYVSVWLVHLWGTMLCSAACAVLAEWHAPERR